MTIGELTRRILDNEIRAFERSAILEVVEQRTSGREYLTFNVFNLFLDFDAKSVRIEDELNDQSFETLPLDEFLNAVREKPA